MSNGKQLSKSAKFALSAGVLFALLSVAIGAFAAHGLKSILSEYQLGIVETAAKYQMYHALALLALGLFAMISTASIKWLVAAFTAGIICFSGSLYLLALLDIRWIAFVTPIGGLFLLLGWGLFLVQIYSKRTQLKTSSNT